MNDRIPIADRFWPKVSKGERCWIWTGYRNESGYGTINAGGDGRPLRAHRVAYELCVGPIPEGLTIDHLCRNRACVNPAHLEVVSMRENILRGASPSARHALKTHCPAGHPYDEANTRIFRGTRHCRICEVVNRHARTVRDAVARHAKRAAPRVPAPLSVAA